MLFDTLFPVVKLLNLTTDRAEYLAKWSQKIAETEGVSLTFDLMLNNNFTEKERYFISFFVGVDFGIFLEKSNQVDLEPENETKH